MEVKLKRYQFVNHVLHDLSVNFFVKGAMEAGWTEEEALKRFTQKYVLPDLEDPEDILMTYVRLKRMVQSG